MTLTLDQIDNELDNADLPDKRLSSRLCKMFKQLSQSPNKSLPATFKGHADIKGAYRFFANPDISCADVLEAHYQNTLKRIGHFPVVLLANDTTEIEMGHMEHVQDLGVLNDARRPGCNLHSLVAFTPERICLGHVSARFLKRNPKDLGKKKDNNSRSIEEKESYRWLEDYRKACEIAKKSSAQIVYLADQECDIYEIFAEYEQSPQAADFVIRSKGERLVSLEDGREMVLREAMKTAPILGITEFSLPAIKGLRIRDRKRRQREARKVRQNVRLLSVICKPSKHKKSLPSVRLQVLYLEEIDSPKDSESVNWLLLTTLPMENLQDANTAVHYYLGRWGIETFFHVLKTGCRIEKLQFEEAERLLKCVSLYLVVAWRVLYVMMLGRVSPELSCEMVFDVDEWQCAYARVYKKPPPENSLSMEQMIKIVARLGGHLGRTRDGPPGPRVMWIGLQSVYDGAEGWRACKEMMSRKSYG